MKLGVNIDHIAVLREARKVPDPDPLDALSVCKYAGVDQITMHLREDRRHMQDSDAQNIIKLSALPVNLECSIAEEMIDIACKLRPFRVTLVPENRKEVTTEGGLAVIGNQDRLKNAIKRLQAEEIEVSLFIDPSIQAINAAKNLSVEWIEFHTGRYANLYGMLYNNWANTLYKIEELDLSRKELTAMFTKELEKLTKLSNDARNMDIRVAAGHGLNYQNVDSIAKIDAIEELNIGQSIIARSVYTGLKQAIFDMKEKLSKGNK